MPFTKNQIIHLTIENLSNDGNGVAHWQGQALLCPAPPRRRSRGAHCQTHEKLRLRAIGKTADPGPDRIPVDCPVAGPCGGCGLRHITYEAECAAKTQFVRTPLRAWASWTFRCAPCWG